jgi:hypothetical protein
MALDLQNYKFIAIQILNLINEQKALGLGRSYLVQLASFHNNRVHSSVVEHLTADQEVTGSNPVGPFTLPIFFIAFY